MSEERICPACNKPLERHAKESLAAFAKRQVCDNVCKGVMMSRKHKPKQPKNCSVCGEPMTPLPTESLYNWNRRQTCSFVCDRERRRRANPVPPPKNCCVCDQQFVIRKGETTKRFARRTVCSAKCGGKRRWKETPLTPLRTAKPKPPKEVKPAKLVKPPKAPKPEAPPKPVSVAARIPLDKRSSEQAEIERRCKENIARYWRKRGIEVSLKVEALGDDVFETRSNLVGGVPR